jgi:hypothetical protein
VRTRLRPAYDDVELQRVYAEAAAWSEPWPGHKLRIERTAEIGREMWRGGLVADLSCGDAAVTTQMGVPGAQLILGDANVLPSVASSVLDGNEPARWFGPIEETLDEIPQVELFILTETLEHLDDPDMVLRKIRAKADQLLLSTPCDEQPQADGTYNQEHYWTWSLLDVSWMLDDAGFEGARSELLITHGFTFQIWRAN